MSELTSIPDGFTFTGRINAMRPFATLKFKYRVAGERSVAKVKQWAGNPEKYFEARCKLILNHTSDWLWEFTGGVTGPQTPSVSFLDGLPSRYFESIENHVTGWEGPVLEDEVGKSDGGSA